ncbi:hypothetical protein Tco_1501162 [Tanacetum coccineum]
MTDKIDWENPKGDRFHADVSKPLPLEGPPGRKTIPTRYFFNKDLEYLKHGNQEKKYGLSLSKVKAARYKQEGIKEMIPYLWSSSIQKYDRDSKLGIHHWRSDRQWFYKGSSGRPSTHDEIVVKRTHQKEYMFTEADFLRLNQNNIKDLYLLKIQDKIYNINEVDEYDLINALQLYITRIMIKKRSYTIVSHPKGVVYLGKDNQKMLMRADELPKFSDGTLNKVYRKLDVMLKDNVIGYDNKGLKDSQWTKKGQIR